MRTRVIHSIIFGFALLLNLNIIHTSSAQTAPFPFEGFVGYPRTYKLDARSVAMAEAGIADRGSFSSYTVNPAVLAFNTAQPSLYISGFQNWQNNLMQYDLTSPALSLGMHSMLLRMGYFQPGFSSINPLGENRHPEPDLTLYQVDLTYAIALSPVFSLGLTQTFSYGNNSEAQYATYMVNTGLIYDPDGAISYAAVLNGLGRGLKYRFIEDGTTTLGSREIPTSLQIGATFRFPIDEEEPYLSLSLANQKIFGEEGLWYSGGIEIKPLSFLYLRSGLMFQPDDLIYIPRYGIGIGQNLLQLDYGLSPKLFQDERYHVIGITIQF